MKRRLILVEMSEFQKAKAEKRSTYALPSITVTRNLNERQIASNEIMIGGINYRIMECYTPRRKPK